MGKLLQTLLAVWSLICVDIVGPSFGSETGVTGNTSEVSAAPVLATDVNNVITGACLPTAEARLPKQLSIMGFTESHPFLLIVPSSIKRFLTAGTHKVLWVPCLCKGVDDSSLNGSATAPADGSRSVMTPQTI